MEKYIAGQEMEMVELEEIAGGYIMPVLPVKPSKGRKPNKSKFRWKSAWDRLREMLVL